MRVCVCVCMCACVIACVCVYRDSKLTRLLQESLGGRNKTCIIATSIDIIITTVYAFVLQLLSCLLSLCDWNALKYCIAELISHFLSVCYACECVSISLCVVCGGDTQHVRLRL